MPFELRFFNGILGLGVQVLLTFDDHGLLFDLGMPYEPTRGPFNSFVQPRPGREIEDLLRAGWAPPIAGLYPGDPDLRAGDAVRNLASLTVFTSHADPDHMALLPYIRDDVPVHALKETVWAYRALGLGGKDLRIVAPGAHFQAGPIKVRVLETDHGPQGAAGFIAEAGGLRIGYSGDWRWHGDRPELIDAFIAAAREPRLDALLVEANRAGNRISPEHGPDLTAAELPGRIDAVLAASTGPVLYSFYFRNVHSVDTFTRAFAARDRRLVVHPESADFLAAYAREAGAPRNWLRYDDEDVLADAVRNPGAYVLELRLEDLPLVADVLERSDAADGVPLLHAGGFPLGPFDSSWETFNTWLKLLGIERHALGVHGHAGPADIHRFIAAIDPRVAVPIHTWAPESAVPAEVNSRLPARGEVMVIDGSQ